VNFAMLAVQSWRGSTVRQKKFISRSLMVQYNFPTKRLGPVENLSGRKSSKVKFYLLMAHH